MRVAIIVPGRARFACAASLAKRPQMTIDEGDFWKRDSARLEANYFTFPHWQQIFG
jgi:hypothetical protein